MNGLCSWRTIWPTLLAVGGFLLLSQLVRGQSPDAIEYRETLRESSLRREASLEEPFIGITTDGTARAGLYEIRSTGVTTRSVKLAADAFLAALSEENRARVSFPADDLEWRKWANQSNYYRDGLWFEQMSETERDAAFALLRASLSAKGLKLTRDIMHLNGTLAELNGDDYAEYGEWKYWISLLGEPSLTGPWGWQLDGHHLVINYFVLGDQVVMTPAFWGSEPVVADAGRFEGTRILTSETEAGLQLIRSLDPDQKRQAIIEPGPKQENQLLTQAFSDNTVIPNAGVPVSSFTGAQKQSLRELIGLYVGNLREPHARVRMAEVERHLDETRFAWIGLTDDDAVFYYRIMSPVILIEFDHQRPVGLRHLYPDGLPYREHVHAVVRSPNGNDYGKDLLRQHYRRYAHGERDASGVARWHQ